MRRDDRQITDRGELDRILGEALVVRLGMVDSGRPYVVPLNFAHRGDVLWFHCAGIGRKLDCLRANPEVCIEADRLIGVVGGESPCGDWTSRYESVIGFGAAEFVEDGATKVQGLRAIMHKYSGRDDWEFDAGTLEGTVVVRVRLRSLTGKRSPAAG
jgi:nitroimidazol reductase NimA-like FMN-containing flavoprotein (pyridoxamine 5'-phosphate oxidase superfamily)